MTLCLPQSCPEITVMHRLVQDFAGIFRDQRADALSKWMNDAVASGLPPIQRFCAGLCRDRSAVIAALSTRWSNGQVEGQVHRLKLIKRQMYGRVGFQLLKCRVLPYLPSAEFSGWERAP